MSEFSEVAGGRENQHVTAATGLAVSMCTHPLCVNLTGLQGGQQTGTNLTPV